MFHMVSASEIASGWDRYRTPFAFGVVDTSTHDHLSRRYRFPAFVSHS